MASYRTKGTCAREIIYNIDENNIVTGIKFLGGCSGNLQAVSRLVNGKKVEEVIPLLIGIKCRNGTSCPDQLAIALSEHKRKP